MEDDIDTFFGEGDVVAIISVNAFGSICFGDDTNIFSSAGGGVEAGVATSIDEGDFVDGGTIENPL